MDMDVAWYFRLFYIPILSGGIAYLLALIIKAKRMTGPEIGKPMMILSLMSLTPVLFYHP